MIRWQFAANNNAIRTVVGDKVAEVIRLRSRQGCGLYGRFRPGRVELYRPLVGKLRLVRSPGDLVKMAELQRKIRIVWGELLCPEVMRLGAG
jgi:hypothetical protein